MKKLGLWISLVGILLISTGCTIGEAKLVNSKKISGEAVNEVYIDYGSDNIRIYESDSSDILIKEYLRTNNRSAKADIEETKGKVSIKAGRRKNHFFSFGVSSHVDVYLPKEYKESLIINNKSGSIKLDTYFELKSIKTNQKSGSLKINQLKAEEMTFNVTSGSISGEEIEAKEIIANSNSGSIKLNKVIGNANMKTTSGSIKTSFKSIDSFVNTETTSGSIKLGLPKNLSFELVAKVNSGSIRTDFDDELSKSDKKVSGTIGTGELKSITAKATSGSIKINQD